MVTERKYFGNWSYRKQVMDDFDLKGKERKAFPNDEDIIFAAYGTPSYEGYAIIVFNDGDRLMEVNAAHCSCYGLEGQWTPEQTSVAALAIRNLNGYEGYGSEAEARYKELFPKRRKKR